MGRVYTASAFTSSITGSVDWIEIAAPADAVVVLHSVTFGQSSDAGDSESEMLRWRVGRVSTSGSGGSTGTPGPASVGDPAFGGTVETFNTTQAAAVTLFASTLNVQLGLEFYWNDQYRIIVSPSDAIVIGAQEAPDDELGGVWVTVTFEEIGG